MTTTVRRLGVSLAAAVYIVLCTGVSAAIADTKSLSGLVKNATDGAPVTATEVRIDAGHFDTTTDSGGFAIPWSPPLKAGHVFTFQVKGWMVVDPCVMAPGRLYLPDP